MPWERLDIRSTAGRRCGDFGWGDICKDVTFLAPDGTAVTQLVADDTLPGGHRTVERAYTARFACTSHEDDYRTAWAFFQPAA